MKIFKHLLPIILLGFLAINSCEEMEYDTGLEGTVFKGPINPVEMPGVINDLPFSGEFKVYNSSEILITTFTSNDSGLYRILLVPGDYMIVPDESVPIINPGSQVKNVTVNSDTITDIDLYFDTGIR